MNKTFTLLVFLCISALIFNQAYSQEQSKAEKKDLITLEDIWLRYTFYPNYVSGLNSLNDGKHYTELEKEGIVKYSFETGDKIETIIKAEDLVVDGSERPIQIQDYSFNKDESKALITTNKEPIYRHSYKATNYLWDLKTKKLLEISKDQKQQLTTMNDDGTKLAYVRDNNIYLFDIATQKEIQITTDGKVNEIINGAPDWVYEEEFGFAQGFEWSPDGKKIAFYKFDESKVKQWSMRYYGELYPDDYTYKYPKAGEDNSIVNVYVYNIESQKTVKMDVGTETDQYIPRINWTNDNNTLCITRLNRLQNKLELLLSDVNTGTSKVILTETNKYYVDITDNLTFLKDGKHFIWSSEQSGYNHLYLYDLTGKLINQITDGNWDVVEFLGVDEPNDLLYYISAENSPTQRDLYSINLNGKKKKRLTKEDGTNSVYFSTTFDYFINTHSDANTPVKTTLHDKNGKLIRELETNKDLVDKLQNYMVSKKEFFTFKTENGTELNGWMIKPYNFTKSNKYPVFVTIYGGPGINTVNDDWEYTMLWHQYIAQKGYIVVSVDPRGTGYRGEEFKKQTYLQLGKLEAEDMIETAKYLGGLSYVDKDRIGIQGWSYGGYLSSLSLFKGGDYFKMAIAVAPVTNWRFYDNIYTERFMRTPQENPSGYDDNSPINFAKNLKGSYLLIHGGTDDNVHIQNTMELAKALNDAGKQFDMHIYPNKNHSIYGGYTRYHLFTKMSNFIFENL